jgi:osmotically-inducible protein OsmY
MIKQGCFIILLSTLLTGCLGSLWTGATLIYDRHSLYKQVRDYRLTLRARQALFKDEIFKPPLCSIDLAVFKGNILIAGHVPNTALYLLANKRLAKVQGFTHIYNKLQISKQKTKPWLDSWITTRIRTKILMDESIAPNSVKVITVDAVVYLMGEMHTEQAKTVVQIASNTPQVKKVVTLLTYFVYQKSAE